MPQDFAFRNSTDGLVDRLSKYPANFLATKMVEMALSADRSSQTNFLHYWSAPDDAALDMSVSACFKAGAERIITKAEPVLDENGKPVLDENGKPMENLYYHTPKFPSLDFSSELSHLTGDGELHKLLIGDNFHALAGMTASGREEYDLIYIDPPYNTGRDDMRYNDNFVGEDDPWRHTKWLSLIEPRLRIARHLMKRTGVIFISIDDFEVYTLKTLCDAVFGKDNFIANVVWNGASPKGNARFVSTDHEYILVYAKNRGALIDADARWEIPKEGIGEVLEAARRAWDSSGGNRDKAEELYRNWRKSRGASHLANSGGVAPFQYFDENGELYRSGDISGRSESGPARGSALYDVLHPVTGKPVKVPANGWRCSESTMREWISQGRVLFGKDENSVPGFKRKLSDYTHMVPPSVFSSYRGIPDSHVTRVLGDGEFDYPKDHTVLSRWITAVAPRDGKILDFFGGTGSTAEAVLLANKLDGGTRTVTIVTNDDGGIGTKVTRERIVRVMTGKGWADGSANEGYGGKLAVYYVEAREELAPDFSTDYVDRPSHHAWDGEAGKWSSLFTTPIPVEITDEYQVLTNSEGTEHTAVFHNHERTTSEAVELALEIYPDAMVYLTSHAGRLDTIIDVDGGLPLSGAARRVLSIAGESVIDSYVNSGGSNIGDLRKLLSSNPLEPLDRDEEGEEEFDFSELAVDSATADDEEDLDSLLGL